MQKRHASVSSKQDIRDIAVQRHHQKVSALAAQQVVLQDVVAREFNAFSLNIRQKDIPKAKAMMRDFIDQFLTTIEAPPQTGEASYQLNLQFFALTGSEKGK